MEKIVKNIKPLIKYTLVGGLGTFIDLAVLYILVEYALFPILFAATISFLCAVVNNFLLNKIWTFKVKSKNYRKLFVKFFLVSLVGLGLTVGLMYILVNVIELWYMAAKVLTSLVVLTWNFLANKLWTFKVTPLPVGSTAKPLFDLSIVIPAYNEENRIKETLLKIEKYIKEKNLNAEVIVSDDGSKDQTLNVVESLKEGIPHLSFLRAEKNSGKGFAIKKGVEASQGKYILFTDADNSTPIEEFEKLMMKLNETGKAIAIGSRYLPDSQVKIKQPKYRIVMGRMGNFLIRLFLLDDIKDTQCGFKLFEQTAAKEIFAFQKVKRFAFDMEALVIAENFGYEVVEVPVSWFNSTESRVRPIRDMFVTLKDLIYIKLNLWAGRYSRDQVQE